jgi:hypothetical protein
MIRIILFWLILFALFFFGFKILRSLSGSEAWALTKLVSYAILCSLLATGLLIFIVVLF